MLWREATLIDKFSTIVRTMEAADAKTSSSIGEKLQDQVNKAVDYYERQKISKDG